jgi:hypothetical protein
MADLIRAKHDVFGVADVPDTDYYRDLGWSKVDPATPTDVEAARQAEADAFHAAISFDPAEHKAEEVVEHLASADEDEAARVLAAEKSGKARKTVLDA